MAGNYGPPAKHLVETIVRIVEGQQWVVHGQLVIDGDDDTFLEIEGDTALGLVIEQ